MKPLTSSLVSFGQFCSVDQSRVWTDDTCITFDFFVGLLHNLLDLSNFHLCLVIYACVDNGKVRVVSRGAIFLMRRKPL